MKGSIHERIPRRVHAYGPADDALDGHHIPKASGHVRGVTTTMPLHIEILYQEYNFVGAFAVASLLTLLAVVTLVIKTLVEWRTGYKRK